MTLFGALAVGLLAGWIIRTVLGWRTLAEQARLAEGKIRTVRGEAAAAREQAAEIADELGREREELAASDAALRRLRTEFDAQLEALDRARQQRAALEIDSRRIEGEVARLADRIGELAPLEARVADLKEEHRSAEAGVAEFLVEVDRLTAAKQATESERARLAARVAGLEAELAQAAQIARQEFERRSRQLETWHTERTRMREEIVRAEERQEEMRDTLRLLTLERDQARTSLRQARLDYEGRLAAQQSKLGVLGAQAARVEPLLRLLEERDQSTRESAVRHEARMRDLESRLARVSRERDRLEATTQRYLAELETLKAEGRERDQRFLGLAREFRTMAAAKDQEIIGLRAHGEGLEAQLQDWRWSDENGTMPAPTDGVSRDDLQRIRGIGPALERVLNDEGIFLFSQIASWTPADVARIAERLSAFPDRIQRDDWVGSARREHRRKYGIALP